MNVPRAPVGVNVGRNARVQVFLWIALGVAAAVATTFTGWVAELVKSDRAEATTEEVKEAPGIEKRKSTLGYHLGRSAAQQIVRGHMDILTRHAYVDGPGVSGIEADSAGLARSSNRWP